MPTGKLVKLGIWEDDQFIGAVLYGWGATSALVKQYGLRQDEGCELVRIAMRNHQTPVTRIVSITLKKLKRLCPGLRLVVSFADPDQNHMGVIYQAGNWIYSGRSQASDEYIYRGRRWQGRSFRNSFKQMEKHPDVKIVKGSSKHRYLMPLDSEMRTKILSYKRSYPKRATSKDNVASIDQIEEDGVNPIVALQ